jgi:hypothetical protein
MLANVLEERAGRANNSTNGTNNSDSMQLSSHNSSSSIAPLIARLKEVRGLNMLVVLHGVMLARMCDSSQSDDNCLDNAMFGPDSYAQRMLSTDCNIMCIHIFLCVVDCMHVCIVG